MTLLNPTPDELSVFHAERLSDLKQRARRWHQQRWRFQRNLALAGGLLLLFTARMWAFGGTMSWSGYVVFLATGSLLGWCIACWSLGILRGMMLYGSGAFAVWWCCAALGWWSAGGGFGGVILMVIGWLSWIVIGGALGMISEQFDDDHLQV
jgi:hypothetical protein